MGVAATEPTLTPKYCLIRSVVASLGLGSLESEAYKSLSSYSQLLESGLPLDFCASYLGDPRTPHNDHDCGPRNW